MLKLVVGYLLYTLNCLVKGEWKGEEKVMEYRWEGT